jgi:hypothetical protein
MKCVRFWGTRGSLPVALTAAGLRRKLTRILRDASGRSFASDVEIDAYLDKQDFAVAGTYGGHSSCVEIETGGTDYVLCDLGSGARAFGQAAMARHGPGAPQTYHIVVSHMHWDHIMGLPFFIPAYLPGNRIRIYGGHQGLEMALRRQQDQPSFPVDFSAFKADIKFVHIEPLRFRRPDGRLLDRLGAQARRPRGDRRLRRVLSQGRRRDFRRHVFACRRRLDPC